MAGNMFTEKRTGASCTPAVSVIIAIRNGEKSIPQLLSELTAQEYSGKLEFILVDDASNDATKILILKQTEVDQRFIYESSANGDSLLSHKKRALDAGIKKARHKWLLFTDADCRLQSGWVNGMAANFNDESDYVLGYSEVEGDGSLVTRFQSMDFFMLMTAARGAANSERAWACSGQNQAFRKSLFAKVGGYSTIAGELQGDDSLFLQLCRKKGSARVVFADAPECRVIARQEKTWRSFLSQRMRWAGDANIMWRFNRLFFISILATFLLPALLIQLLFASVFIAPYYFTIVVKFLTLRFVLEFFHYFSGIRQFNKPIKLWDFLSWYFIQIPYIVFMGISSFFQSRMSWRGRGMEA